jgi:hypothetical protein
MSSTANIQLWESLLKKSSKNNQQQQQKGDGTLLLLGDTGCGKRSLADSLSSLSSSSSTSSNNNEPLLAEERYPEYISYSYFNAAGEDGLKINMWRMCRGTFRDSHDLILNPSRGENVSAPFELFSY